MEANRHNVKALHSEFELELFENVIPFWEKHSLDEKHGGLCNCLDRVGKVYDTTKHSWLQARQVWMFSTLYNHVEQRSLWLRLAKSGVYFVKQHAIREDGRVYFSLTEKGEPIYLQRKIFSECFYTIALAEYARATNATAEEREAADMFECIWEMAFTPGKAGRPVMSGDDVMQALAVPMILRVAPTKAAFMCLVPCTYAGSSCRNWRAGIYYEPPFDVSLCT